MSATGKPSMPRIKRAADLEDWGGSAFPIPADWDSDGMSLLDWFAGMALSGICSNPEVAKRREDRPDHVANVAYELAEKMLKARDAK